MRGPSPKNPATRQRRNKPATAAQLPPEPPPPPRGAPKGAIPPLPRRKGKGETWSAMTRAFWADVWRSPMATRFLQADKHRLYMLAELWERFWREPTATLAGEIRLQSQAFGITPVDRWRLGWGLSDKPQVPEPDAAPPSPQQPTAPAAPAPAAAAAAGDPRRLLTMVPRT